MAATVQFQTQLTYHQVADLARQLPPRDKQKLAKLLAKETKETEKPVADAAEAAPKSLEDQLTPVQRKTWANIRQGFEELKLMREGKIQARPLSEFLAELKEEGYL